ncbi:MAG TPA: hypothetical protein VNI02_13235 [Blastocatellia bacterium]|nr:hypothetical protein [Blastocatellia bacterium]
MDCRKDASGEAQRDGYCSHICKGAFEGRPKEPRWLLAVCAT